MNKSALQFLVAGLGLACAALLLWLWRADRPEPNPLADEIPSAEAAPSSVAGTSATSSDLTATISTLLDALQQALVRFDARDREVLLTFKDEEVLRDFVARAARSGLDVLGQNTRLNTVRVRFDHFPSLQDDLLQHAEDYAGLSANVIFQIPRVPLAEERADLTLIPFRNQALVFLGAAEDRTSWGRGTTIAILDTGVAPDATFGSGRLRAIDIGLGLEPESRRDGGHGTAVAALAAGLADDAPGIAPAANLLSIRVTDASGTSDLFTIAQAIVAAVDAGANIVNLSLGGYSTGPLLDSALAYAGERGVAVVAAAGNDQAAELAWPAADSRVISVGAVDRAGQQVTFSNSGAQLQLAAPGYGVQTAWLDGQRGYVDGTSVSAPLVAGAIAAVMSQQPGLTPTLAAQRLVATASDAGAPGPDPAFGNGILNLGWAMNRDNPAYIDTAVASHYYDSAGNQLLVVVQNRSGRTVSGLNLAISASEATSTQTVPSLGPGESYIARLPVNAAALNQSGRLTFSTELINPPGIVDRAPINNQRSSVLTAPE